MKNKQYIYMLLAAGLTLGACSSDKDALEDELQPVQPTSADGESVGFAATTVEGLEYLADEDLDAQGGPDSRVRTISVGSDFKVTAWYTNDKISVSDGVLNYTYSPESESSDPSCNFNTSGNAFVTDGSAESENTFYAFYPQEAVSSWNGATVTSMIWAEQLYSENVEGSGILGPYIAAKSETTGGGANATFKFGHLCSVVDVDLSKFDGGTVESVSLYSNAQRSLAGKLYYNFDSKVLGVENNDNTGYCYSTQSTVVRVSNINVDKPVVRFYLLPTKQDKGFTITVRTTDGQYYSKSSSTAVGTSDVNASYLSSVTNGRNGSAMAACLPYYKKYNFGVKSSARPMNWMAMVPGNIRFNMLSIPGTHDAATAVGNTNNYSYYRCQDYSIEDQLTKGCRAFDLRPRYNSSTLQIYHAAESTNYTLETALTAITNFLADNPTETAFVLIHEETPSSGSYSHQTAWATRVQNCLDKFTSYIASYGWTGTLDGCRGKMVIICRDEFRDGDINEDKGCGRVGWGSSFGEKTIATGTYNSSNPYSGGKGTLFYQDEYSTTNGDTKLANIEKLLTDFIMKENNNWNYLYINNTNIASGTTSNATLAERVHPKVLASSTITNWGGRFGVMMVDYLFSTSHYGDKMFELIHQQNYKYVYTNRTRKSIASPGGTGTGVNVSGDEYADDSEVFGKQR